MTVWKGNSMVTVAARDPHISGKDSGKGDSDVNDSDSDVSREGARKDFSSYKGQQIQSSHSPSTNHRSGLKQERPQAWGRGTLTTGLTGCYRTFSVSHPTDI